MASRSNVLRVNRPKAVIEADTDVVVLIFDDNGAPPTYHTLKRSLLLPFLTHHAHMDDDASTVLTDILNSAPVVPETDDNWRNATAAGVDMGVPTLRQSSQNSYLDDKRSVHSDHSAFSTKHSQGTHRSSIKLKRNMSKRERRQADEDEEEAERLGKAANRRRAHAVTGDYPMLHARDLRFVERSLELDIDAARAAILVRQGCLVVTLMTVRAVIVAHRMIVFVDVGGDDDLQHIVTRFTRRNIDKYGGDIGPTELRARLRDADSGCLWHDDDLPFELFCLESLLIAGSCGVQRRYSALERRAKAVLSGIHGARGHAVDLPKFDELRHVGHGASRLLSAARGIQRAISSLLDCEQDMRGLVFPASRESLRAMTYVMPNEPGDMAVASRRNSQTAGLAAEPDGTASRHNTAVVPTAVAPAGIQAHEHAAPPMGRRPSDASSVLVDEYAAALDIANTDGFADEVAEVLVEVYLAQVDSLTRSIDQLKQEVEGVDQHARLVFDTSRNSLWVSQVALSGAICGMVACMLVANYFGMNLGNASREGLADSNRIFLLIVIICTAVAAIITGCGLTRILTSIAVDADAGKRTPLEGHVGK